MSYFEGADLGERLGLVTHDLVKHLLVDGNDGVFVVGVRAPRAAGDQAEATRAPLETLVVSRGTDGSNPVSSSGESANFRFLSNSAASSLEQDGKRFVLRTPTGFARFRVGRSGCWARRNAIGDAGHERIIPGF
jgi:hypothetical protein